MPLRQRQTAFGARTPPEKPHLKHANTSSRLLRPPSFRQPSDGARRRIFHDASVRPWRQQRGACAARLASPSSVTTVYDMAPHPASKPIQRHHAGSKPIQRHHSLRYGIAIAAANKEAPLASPTSNPWHHNRSIQQASPSSVTTLHIGRRPSMEEIIATRPSRLRLMPLPPDTSRQ